MGDSTGESASPRKPQKRERSSKPAVSELAGTWDHSLLQMDVVVEGAKAVIGKGTYKFTVNHSGLVTEVCGWTLQHFDGNTVSWKARDGSGHTCRWTRKQTAPKRFRQSSEKQMESERDTDVVNDWLAHQRRAWAQHNHLVGVYKFQSLSKSRLLHPQWSRSLRRS